MALALLWHLHQPDYRDPRTGVPLMPWVRLHALRGYLDLLTETVESGVPWTINIVPSLWEQLLHYAGGGSDPHLELTARPADALDAHEVEQIRRTFPCGHPNMRATPRYRAIEARIAAGEPLSEGELRDLQVLSTLVWVGATALERFPILAALREKGRGFSESDKRAMLDVQAEILRGLPHLVARLGATEGPALSVSPQHHPILPLLIDLRLAARSVRHPPPVDLAVPHHARLQLRAGRRTLEAAAGRPVVGCWPPEGAVCPELVPLLAEEGFRWVASDEDVLARSRRRGDGWGPWSLGEGVVGFFRDRELSDRIGFRYAKCSAEDAVNDLCASGRTVGTRLIALDGENPWEAFPDAGAAFRRALVERLMDEGITLDAAAETEPVGVVEELHTGSWIGANLEIWAGHEEDHRAWMLLAQTVEAVGDEPAALPSILAAEGSDWFWWYGPEFDTPFSSTFDAIFRAHLRAAWLAAGREAPAVLDVPIVGERVGWTQPDRTVEPAWGEPGWFGAGRWCPPRGAMAPGEPSELEIGWDRRGALWIRGPEGLGVEVDGERIVLRPEGIELGPKERARLVLEGATLWVERVDWVV